MQEFLEAHKVIISILAGGSVIMFFGTLILLPILIIRMPANYFVDEARHNSPYKQCHPVLCITGLIIKNLLGIIFLLTGIIMLLTPGQGLLSIIIGITLLNYPGKYRFERWLVSRKKIRGALNWIRHKAHKPPLAHN